MAEDRTSLPGIGTPDYTRMSQGSIPDTSTATLVKDLGETFIAGVNAVDQGIKSFLRDDLAKEIDATRDDSIKQTAVDTEALLGKTKPEVPPDLEASLDRASRMSKAKALKSTSDTHYYAQLDSTVRNARARFPAYRDYIDDYVSKLTGVVPANALRRALQGQQAALQQNTQDPTKRLSELLKRGSEAGVTFSEFEPYLKQGAVPQNVLAEAEIKVLSAVAAKNKTTIEANKFDLEMKAGKVDAERSKLGFRERVTNLGLEALGPDQSLYRKLASYTEPQFREFVEKNPEEVKRTIAGLANLKLKFQQRVAQEAIRSGFNKTMDRADIDAEQKSVEQWVFGNLESALLNKDYGALSATAQQMQAMKESDAYKLTGMEGIRTIQAVQSALGPEMAKFVYSSNPLLLSSVAKADFQTRLSRTLAQSVPGVKASTVAEELRSIEQDASIPTKEKSTRSQALIDGARNAFLKAEDPRIVSSAAAALFTGKDPLINSVAKGKDKLYETLSSKEMTDRIKFLGSQGQEGIVQAYTNFLSSSFIQVTKEQIGTLQNARFRPDLDLEFDPKTLQFKAVKNPRIQSIPNNPVSGLVAGVGNITEAAILEPATQAAVDKFNRSLLGLKNLGVLNEESILNVIRNSGILDTATGQGKQASGANSIAGALNGWYQRQLDKALPNPEKTQGRLGAEPNVTVSPTEGTPFVSTPVIEGGEEDRPFPR